MSMLQRAIYSMVQIKFEHCIYMALVLVGADTLGSLLGGSLDGLLAGEDSGDTGKSSLNYAAMTNSCSNTLEHGVFAEFATKAIFDCFHRRKMKKEGEGKVCSHVTVARL